MQQSMQHLQGQGILPPGPGMGGMGGMGAPMGGMGAFNPYAGMLGNAGGYGAFPPPQQQPAGGLNFNALFAAQGGLGGASSPGTHLRRTFVCGVQLLIKTLYLVHSGQYCSTCTCLLYNMFNDYAQQTFLHVLSCRSTTGSTSGARSPGPGPRRAVRQPAAAAAGHGLLRRCGQPASAHPHQGQRQRRCGEIAKRTINIYLKKNQFVMSCGTNLYMSEGEAVFLHTYCHCTQCQLSCLI